MKAWFDAWWASASLWEAAKFFVPTILSALALGYVIYDRRPHLTLKSRKGNWHTVDLGPGQNLRETRYEGIIEIYNRSSRANAIREYRFTCRDTDGTPLEMESELYSNTCATGGGVVKHEVFNQTPLPLAPYSGIEARLQAFAKMPMPDELSIDIEVEDLFGKRYSVRVIATT